MSQRAKWCWIIAGSLSAWFLLVTMLWAIRPLHDTVPVGKATPESPPSSQEVQCNSLFESRARDDVALPTLVEPLAYERSVCSSVHREARIVFGIDALVTAAGLGAVVAVVRRGQRHDKALLAAL